MDKFFVFSLPRSRSFWLSKFLSYRWKRCGHDLTVGMQHPRDLAGRMVTFDGSCETGAVVGWQAMLDQFPDAKMVVVKRPLIEICRSLERQGLVPHLIDLGRKAFLLQELASIDGVLTCRFGDLNSPHECRLLFEHCLEEPMDLGWWESLAPVNMQVDLRARLTDQVNNAVNIAVMKALTKPPRVVEGNLTITEESFGGIWPEARPLAEAHYREIEPEGPKRFNLDLEAMMRMWQSGNHIIFGARIDGRLVGYVTWNISFDVECYGSVQAQQGAWFIDPSCRGLGAKLFDYSVEQLKRASVDYIFPHHRMQGRSVDLGPFFTRRGAVEIQRTYYKWMKEDG